MCGMGRYCSGMGRVLENSVIQNTVYHSIFAELKFHEFSIQGIFVHLILLYVCREEVLRCHPIFKSSKLYSSFSSVCVCLLWFNHSTHPHKNKILHCSSSSGLIGFCAEMWPVLFTTVLYARIYAGIWSWVRSQKVCQCSGIFIGKADMCSE